MSSGDGGGSGGGGGDGQDAFSGGEVALETPAGGMGP